MMFDLIGLGLAAWLGAAETSRPVWPHVFPSVTFNPRLRAVSDWRWEAMTHLDPPLGIAVTLLLGRDPQAVTRCVRLNNYWCIKRAGWAGEIAADADGHVAFASALEGADVAALLLRRYYVDYGRHSARAIISHWAPANCGLGVSIPTSRVTRSAADHLTTRGLGRTLRARFLAGHGRRIAGRARGRASIVPDRLIGTPTIALALGGDAVDLGSQALASLPLTVMGAAPSTKAAVADLGCVADDARVRAYAAKAAAGIAPNADADLRLFDASGAPTPNLARVMENMSAVEIGPLGAGRALIADAVENVRQVAVGAAATRSPATKP